MTIRYLSLLTAALALGAAPLFAQLVTAMNPVQAVAAAQTAGDGGVTGVVDMVVGSTGAAGFQVFLNSARDYHDPANLTVQLGPGARAQLKSQLGGEPEDLMLGRHVRVQGVIRRIALPRRDGTVAYQTRIEVDRVEQITIVGQAAIG